MRIFIALVFIVITVIGLVRGTIFKDRINKLKENAGKYLDNEIDDVMEYTKIQFVTSAPMLFSIALLMILELIFYFSVVGIAALTIPTIFMMLFFIIQLVNVHFKNKKNKVESSGDPEVDLEERAFATAQVMENLKTRTVYGTFIKVVQIIYFVFALLVLI